MRSDRVHSVILDCIVIVLSVTVLVLDIIKMLDTEK